LVEYKKRAAKVLQAKEVTIAELTDKLSNSESTANPTGISIAELIQVRQERDSLREDLDEASETIIQLRATITVCILAIRDVAGARRRRQQWPDDSRCIC
jgi:uncharacterized coiled-coil DUF342 family protein